jgi:hypothetical protein
MNIPLVIHKLQLAGLIPDWFYSEFFLISTSTKANPHLLLKEMGGFVSRLDSL